MTKEMQAMSCQAESCKNMATFFLHCTIEIDDRTILQKGQTVPMRIPLCKDHASIAGLSAEHGSSTWGITEISEEIAA